MVFLYNVASVLFGMVTTVFTGYCLVKYLDAFLEEKKLFERGRKIFLITVFIFTDYVIDYFFSGVFETKETIGKLFLLMLTVFLFAKVFYNSALQKIIFVTVTFVAIRDLSSFICTVVILYGSKLFEFWIWLMEKEYVSATTVEQLIDVTASLLQMLMMVVYMFFLYGSLKAVDRNYKDKDYPVHKKEFLFLITPGWVGFLLCILLRAILITMENGVPTDLYEKYPILMPVVPAILLLALFSIVYSVKIFQDLVALGKEKTDRLILEKQIHNLQEHIEEMEHIYDGVRSMKHDMKNTLSVIMQLAVNKEQIIQGEYQQEEELQRYLKELNQTMDRLEFRYKTGNSVVDVLLNMKYHEIVRMIPELQLNADRLLFPKNLEIQSYDIGIIIGNALDNAIEACKKLKSKEPEAEVFITLASFVKGKMLFLEVENSFDGKVITKKYSEFPMTDKKDKEAHGIGFSNMKNTALKYHGDVDWSVEDRKFVVTVMLQNTQS